MSLALVLAAVPVKDDKVAPGMIVIAIIALLSVSLFLLIRSMNKQIGKIQAPKAEELVQAEWERRQGAPSAQGRQSDDAEHPEPAGSGDNHRPAES